MREILITGKDAGQRLDKYLRKYLPEAGSGFLYKMLRKKNITLNGKKAEGNELLQAEDVIRIFFSEDTFAKMRGKIAETGESDTGERKNNTLIPSGERQSKAAEAYRKLKGIDIVYEDEHLLFVNKPAGILSQGDDSGQLSLNDWILGYCLHKGADADNAVQTAVCNRLDRNTSGLVLCGKTYAGSRFLSDQIKSHGFRKIYRAVVEGHLSGEGLLKGYWSKDEKANLVRITEIQRHAKDPEVQTAYRAMAYHAEEDLTLAEVELITGKSHQIRAHMAAIGHPLAGDVKYGGHTRKGIRSQLLHAYAVRFPKLEGTFAALSEKEFCCETAWLKEWG
jgi:23S rRNA pseudouridine955/2504/2580 synthase